MSQSKKEVSNYTVILEREQNGGYHDRCSVLKGCHSQGDSFEEASANVSEAIELYIESLKADQEPIPKGNLIVQQVCVSV